MEGLLDWLKQTACCLCVFQLFLQILPDGEAKKYVQFFASLVLVLLVAGPLTELTGVAFSFQRELQLFSAREELAELNLGIEGLGRLQEDVIDEAFRQELTRQARELAKTCGLTETQVSLRTRRDAQGIPQVQYISIEARGTKEAAGETLRQLCRLYGLAESSVVLRVSEA